MRVTSVQPSIEPKTKTKKKHQKLIFGLAGFLAAAVIGTSAASAAQLSPTAAQTGSGYGTVCDNNTAICVVINGGTNIINITINYIFGNGNGGNNGGGNNGGGNGGNPGHHHHH